MNFGFTADEQAFAEEVRAFLRANPPESFPEDGMDAGYGSGAHSRAFLRALGSRGWLSMCWPARYGGQERPMMWKLILLEELGLAYRSSVLPEGAVIVEALFEAPEGDPVALAARMEEQVARRDASQPTKDRTAGSTFRNPSGFSSTGPIRESRKT